MLISEKFTVRLPPSITVEVGGAEGGYTGAGTVVGTEGNKTVGTVVGAEGNTEVGTPGGTEENETELILSPF
jgi:hypothetical protein